MKGIKLPSRFPLVKVTAGTLSSVAVLLLVLALREFAGIEVSADLQSAIGILVFFVVSYMVPIQPSELYEPLEDVKEP